MENVWEYLRGNKLDRLVWDSYEAMVAACEEGWDFLINNPDRIRSIGHQDWVCVNVQVGWYDSSFDWTNARRILGIRVLGALATIRQGRRESRICMSGKSGT